MIYSSVIQTPIGEMRVCASDIGICLLEFDEKPRIEIQLKKLKRIFQSGFQIAKTAEMAKLEEQLSQYFLGKRKHFNVSLDARGTEFQQKVWDLLLKIPFGFKKSYSDIATEMQKPLAVRAVGKANGENRIAIVVPCHRLVGKSGDLTGYGGGLWRKRFLLDLESKNLSTKL